MTLKQWVYGLAAAAIGAAANGILIVIVNPGTFDIFSKAGWKNIATSCGVSALVALAAFLKQSPLPDASVSTKVTTTIETHDEGSTT